MKLSKAKAVGMVCVVWVLVLWGCFGVRFLLGVFWYMFFVAVGVGFFGLVWFGLFLSERLCILMRVFLCFL